jgi:hypothetical protein
MILAIYASKIASRKENIADAFFPANNRFFSRVYADRSNIHISVGFTVSPGSLQTVYIASPWTYGAFPEP